MLSMILDQLHSNITVRNTPHGYQKTIGNPRHPMVQMGLKKLEDVSVYRLLIERKSNGGMLPPIHISQNKLQELKSRLPGNPGSWNLFSLGRNNHGNYLLEIPDCLHNWTVCWEFLTWLDTITGELTVRKEAAQRGTHTIA